MLFYVTLSHNEYRYHPEEGGYYAPDFIVDDSSEWYYPNSAKQDLGGCLVSMLREGWKIKYHSNLHTHISNWVQFDAQTQDYETHMPYVELERDSWDGYVLSITLAPQYSEYHHYC